MCKFACIALKVVIEKIEVPTLQDTHTLPVLMYGCEGERWRTRYNFELARDFDEPNIVAVVKVQRLRWAGHLVRMEESRAPSMLFRNNLEGRRGVGRPKTRWVDGVEADLRALGVRSWQSVARDRSRWIQVLDQARARKWL